MKIKSSTQTAGGGDNKIIETYSGLLFVSANYLTKILDILSTRYSDLVFGFDGEVCGHPELGMCDYPVSEYLLRGRAW